MCFHVDREMENSCEILRACVSTNDKKFTPQICASSCSIVHELRIRTSPLLAAFLRLSKVALSCWAWVLFGFVFFNRAAFGSSRIAEGCKKLWRQGCTAHHGFHSSCRALMSSTLMPWVRESHPPQPSHSVIEDLKAPLKQC